MMVQARASEQETMFQDMEGLFREVPNTDNVLKDLLLLHRRFSAFLIRLPDAHARWAVDYLAEVMPKIKQNQIGGDDRTLFGLEPALQEIMTILGNECNNCHGHGRYEEQDSQSVWCGACEGLGYHPPEIQA